ncbi:DUF1266 domain-containing protein [Microbacterium halophytorum]|uniref:DUF1266 domain-containing protein n=1 Tax=Microbacterium halophytorum TaxID=2067568 RepID=UPI000CFD3D28|nr:DUF1266 domain-containing protein [Microbacterium halophytorum]
MAELSALTGLSEDVLWVALAAVFAIVILVTVIRGRRRIAKARHEYQATQTQSLAEHHRIVWSADAASFGSRPVDWGIALGAPFALCRHAEQDRLRFRDAAEEREILAEAWGVIDRGSMLQTLYDLLLSGHRERFGAEIAQWGGASGAEMDSIEAGLRPIAEHSDDAAEALWRMRRVRADDRGIRSVDFLAWDYVRFAMLARSGATAGYLSQAEAADILLMPAAELREHYGSWEELGESFRLGRWYWNSQGGDGERETDAHDIHRQRTLMSAESPWARVPWGMELPEPRMLFVDAWWDLGVRALDPEEYGDEGEPDWSWRINEALRRRELAERDG